MIRTSSPSEKQKVEIGGGGKGKASGGKPEEAETGHHALQQGDRVNLAKFTWQIMQGTFHPEVYHGIGERRYLGTDTNMAP